MVNSKKLGLSALAATMALSSPSFAEPISSAEDWAYETSENVTAKTPDAPTLGAHQQFGEAFPAIDVAVQQAQPRRFSNPLDAVGKGSFQIGTNTLIHGNSGMICPVSHLLKQQNTGEIVEQGYLFNVSLYDSAGTDVSCSFISEDQTFQLTIFASYWPGVTLVDHFLNAQSGMITHEAPLGEIILDPSVELQLVPNTESKNSQSQIEGATLGFAYDSTPGTDGSISRESLWLNKTRGWHIKVRTTKLPPTIESIVLGAHVHHAALIEVDKDKGGLSNRLVNKRGNDNAVHVNFDTSE